MLSRIIYRRRRGRRFITGVAVVGLAVAALAIAGVALAVHDLKFQLDGDVSASTSTNVGGSQPYDWDSLFNADTSKKALPAGFTASAFSVDFQTTTKKGATVFSTADATTFATGSKDTLDINPGWQCSQANNLLSKNDIMNAYTAAYTDPATGHQYLYFAIERNSNNGDANVAFWFLQGAASCDSSNGTATWSGHHQDGDILIVSAFTNGGGVSGIDAYRWNDPDGSGPAVGSLGTTSVAHGADCNTTAGADAICATTNGSAGTGLDAAITTPWLTSNATDNVGHTLQPSEFFEGGIDLTAKGLGNHCFNTFVGDTRSSQSLTATIFDYALGTLGECSSSTETTPQTGAGASIPSTGISIGTNARVAVKDHAVITVNGITNFGGSVQFSLCGPLALTSTSNCATGGVDIGSPVPLAANATSPASVDSPVTTLTSAGRYCWRATYLGDSSAGVPGSSDPGAGSTSTTECFKVNPVQPTMTTQASGNVAVGGSLTDTATISGTAKQPGTDGLGTGGTINATAATQASAGGQIAWTAYGPGVDGCTNTVTVSGTPKTITGDGTYGPVSLTTTTAGTYTFSAGYNGNNPNTLSIAASGCPDTTGTETAKAGTSSTTTTPQTGAGVTITDHNGNGVPDLSIGTAARVAVRDHVVVSVSGISTWTGSVTFYLCGPLALGSTSNCQTGGAQIGTTATSVSDSATSGNSDTATLTSAGRYCWRGEFSSSTAGVPASSDPKDATSVTECFEVLPLTPSLGTLASANVDLGNPISDTATVTNTAAQPGTDGVGPGGTINATAASQAAAGGSITWTAFGPDGCSSQVFGPTSRTISGDGTYPTIPPQSAVSFTPTAIGVYTFVASYGGNGPNTLASTLVACGDQPSSEKVTVTGTAGLSTAQDWLPNDTATVTGPVNLNGSLTFKLYNDGTCGANSGTVQYTQIVPVSNAPTGSTFSTSNTSHKVTATGSWSWLVTYSDNVLNSPSASCESTSIAITN